MIHPPVPYTRRPPPWTPTDARSPLKSPNWPRSRDAEAETGAGWRNYCLPLSRTRGYKTPGLITTIKTITSITPLFPIAPYRHCLPTPHSSLPLDVRFAAMSSFVLLAGGGNIRERWRNVRFSGRLQREGREVWVYEWEEALSGIVLRGRVMIATSREATARRCS